MSKPEYATGMHFLEIDKTGFLYFDVQAGGVPNSKAEVLFDIKVYDKQTPMYYEDFVQGDSGRS